ncbi:hypothetical protein GGR28_000241 [Lewinella aquimaris]|uniref:DUF3857 domain-containing protein n=1 Tax=Neolewinella aquimaris TaxID=1835722 RepID=A0A840DXI0_9BACT|nr:DUF3857 domain-containing protein [Neolewinella aquimaris]MBB4077640.1 hypothetical protein [Neolewinella aquimaris]
MNVLHYLFLGCLLFWAGAQVQGQRLELSALAAPDSLRTGNSVVLSHDIEYRITSLNSATYSSRKVISLLNADERSGNVMHEFYDDDSKVTTFRAAAYDVFGQQTYKLKNSDISDSRFTSQVSFYEDTRVKYAEIPCATYPCTIVFEVERKVADFSYVAGIPHWQPVRRGQSLVEASFTAYVPSTNELLYRSNLLADPTVATEGDNKVYRWTVSNLPAQPKESYAPAESTTLPYLRLAVADFEIDGFRGSYRSWEDFGKFIGDIMVGRDALPDGLAREVHDRVAGATTELEKIDRLYRFMQERMRYVSIQLGIGGWQPFSAAYVEQNRFGDCKALSNYMGAMLREVGITSYPVLIEWEEQMDYPLTEEFTTSSFNHMVLYVPSQDMYLECTSNDAPTGYLGEDKQDRNVLWITPEGGKLARTPILEPAANGHTRTVDLTVNHDGWTEVGIQATLYGGAQEFFRYMVAELPDPQDQVKWLHEQQLLPDVSGKGYSFVPNKDRPEVSMTYTTGVGNYVRTLGKRLFVPINGYFPESDVPSSDPDRKLPIETYTTRFLVDTVNLHLPPELEFESGGGESTTEFSHTAGEYRSRIVPTETGLQWIRSLKLLPVSLPKEAYAGYRQFFLDVSKAERMQVVVREKRTK